MPKVSHATRAAVNIELSPLDRAPNGEGLAGRPGRDDVGVVAAGHGREGLGAPDAGLLEDGLVEAVPGHLVAVERGTQPAEGVRLAVDDGDGVVPVLEAAREGRADPA